MNFSKKITAGAVALALGASALVVPQADAQTAPLVSRPNPNSEAAKGCEVVVRDVLPAGTNHNLRVGSIAGAEVGLANYRDGNLLTWVSLTGNEGREFEKAEGELRLTNNGETEPVTITGLQNGEVALPESKTINVTDGVSIVDGPVRVPKDELVGFDQKLFVQNGKNQTWAWKVQGQKQNFKDFILVDQTLVVGVAPWPIESNDCQPLLPKDNTTKAIIADGTEYDTGIVVRNASAADIKRLVGEVYNGATQIKDAVVRIDDSGKVFVTVPAGATGLEDNKKANDLQVKLIATPRKGDDKRKPEAYKQNQTLLNEAEKKTGTVDETSTEFVGIVPIQKFAPGYDKAEPIFPGESTTVKIEETTFAEQLRDDRGLVRDADETTFTFDSADVDGWNPKVDEKTGAVTVTAPEGAEDGDKVTVNVTVTYPDGSKDKLATTITVSNIAEKADNDPKYGEQKGKPGDTVKLPQRGKVTDKATYTISEDQELGGWKPTINETTGEITVQIPGSAKPDDVQVILVDVTYEDGTVDKQVPAKVIVLNTPDYGEKTGKPKDTVTLEQTGKTQPGTTFEIDPNQDLGEWKPSVDPQTGVITVVIPEGAKPGERKVINIVAKDPDGGDDVVEAIVNVIGQEYPVTETTPGTGIEVTPVKPVPEGTVFEIDPSDKTGWNPQIDPTTGSITVVIPGTETPGTTKDIPVLVSYPGGEKEIVPAKVIVKEPADKGDNDPEPTGTPETPEKPGDFIIIYPGSTVSVVPSNNQGGTGFKLPDGWKVPEGWSINVDPSTGRLTVVIPESAKPGVTNVPVEVTLPNGEAKVVTVPVYVLPKNGENSTIVVPGGGGTITIPVSTDTKDDQIRLPEGWKFERKGDTVTISIPENVDNGDYPITVTSPDGKGTVTVNVQVSDKGQVPDPAASKENGSSEEAQKCFTKLSTEPNSPLLWILPGAILLGVGAPLVGPLGQEVGKAIANVSAQMNIDIPNPWGNGGDNVRRESPVMATFNAEMARLNNMFGAQVAEAGLIALALVSLASLAGLMAWYCQDDNSEKLSSGMWTEVKANQGEGSSE